MSPHDLELELKRWRQPETDVPVSNAIPLSVEEALSYRNSGNLPDEQERSLRLVLHVNSAAELTYLQQKRSRYEPDFHDAPSWRREGSRPVNVVPLRRSDLDAEPPRAWWDDPHVSALEEEWRESGAVGGIVVPADYRSFVYKTILSLRASGREVTPDSIADSISRWLGDEQAEQIRKAMHFA